MSTKPLLDLELLQTLVAIAEEGSFTRAAIRIGRTQSAVSLQVRRLEKIVGRELIHRQRGGAAELNEAARTLCVEARELLARSERVLQDVRSPDIQGEVRLGSWEGYAKNFLAPLLADFKEKHPLVTVEIFSGLSCQLFPLMLENKLDALLCDSGMEPPGWPTTPVWQTRMQWVTSDHGKPHLQTPLPVSLGPAACPWRPPWLTECLWRTEAIRALTGAGRPYRIVPGLTTIAGWDTSVLSGLAVTISTLPTLPAELRYVHRHEMLPPLPSVKILVAKATLARQPITDCLIDHLRKMALATERMRDSDENTPSR